MKAIIWIMAFAVVAAWLIYLARSGRRLEIDRLETDADRAVDALRARLNEIRKRKAAEKRARKQAKRLDAIVVNRFARMFRRIQRRNAAHVTSGDCP